VTDRRDLLRLTGFLVALLVVAGAIMLATQGGGSDRPDEAAGGQRQIDGLVLQATSELLVLRPSDGSAERRFAIRPTDTPKFDVFHLQQHAADGLLTRVTYVEQDGQLYALRADDAPQPSSG
jgi:hypothetical protein